MKKVNLLDIPTKLNTSIPEQAEKFWNIHNKPFLDKAIRRGDKIVFVSDPTPVI